MSGQPVTIRLPTLLADLIDGERRVEVAGDTVRDALNAFMKAEPVAVLSAEQVGEDFDARTSATARHYRYRIRNRRPPLAIERGRVWWVAAPLDHAAMHEAGQALIGKHDFTTFRAAPISRDNCRALSISRRGPVSSPRAARSFARSAFSVRRADRSARRSHGPVDRVAKVAREGRHVRRGEKRPGTPVVSRHVDDGEAA